MKPHSKRPGVARAMKLGRGTLSVQDEDGTFRKVADVSSFEMRPTKYQCPQCGGECRRTVVHRFVEGFAVGPWQCTKCNWFEPPKPMRLINMEDDDDTTT